MGKTYYAVTDGPAAHIINPSSLASEKFINIGQQQDIVATTAHPHFCWYANVLMSLMFNFCWQHGQVVKAL